MIKRMAFHWYVGKQLASMLPYRRKGLLSGPQACEWQAVVPMTKSGFFVGCSLSLSNNEAAEKILTRSVKAKQWRIEYKHIIEDFERRAQAGDASTVTFEDFFPELTLSRRRDLILTQRECISSIGQRVLHGLMFGILYPEMSSSMLDAWATQKSEWKDLGVGGLQIDSSPLFTSVEEAREHAQSIYEAWRRSGTKVPEARRQGVAAKGPDRGGETEWLQVFLPLHEQITPIVHRILQVDAYGNPAATLQDYLEAVNELPPVLTAMRKAPEPRDRKLREVKKGYERGIDSFIKACEWGVKLCREPSRARLANVVFFTGVGGSLIEEATKKFVAFSGKRR